MNFKFVTKGNNEEKDVHSNDSNNLVNLMHYITCYQDKHKYVYGYIYISIFCQYTCKFIKSINNNYE